MIRWRFVLTRLVVALAILTVLRVGLGPLMHLVTTTGLQSAVGAKVDIGRTRVGLFPPRLIYSDVHVADPRGGKGHRNAVSAESIDLVVDGDSLLRRRLVIRSGRLTGLQIGSDRETDGHFEPQSEPQDAGPSMIGQWLANAGGSIQEGAKSIGRDLQTTRQGELIRRQWEARYTDLLARSTDLERRVKVITETARGIENPLRDWPELQKTLAEAKTVRDELIAVRSSLDELPQRLRTDLQSLEAARQADLRRLDDLLPGQLSNPGGLGVDLVTDSVRTSLRTLRGYIDGGKSVAGYTVVKPTTERTRGVDYDLLGDANPPSLMIARCEVSGLLRNHGKSYTLAGVVENLTPQPHRLTDPTRARLTLEGPETVQIDYTADRRGGQELDRVTVHLPATPASSIRMGKRGSAAVLVDGGQREIWLQIVMRGEDVRGRLVSRTEGVRMQFDAPKAGLAAPAAAAINASLAQVNHVEIEATFNGRWDDLDLDLNTNLGGILDTALHGAVDQQLADSRQRLTAEVDRQHREQTLKLREWLSTQQAEAQSILAKAVASIEAMDQKVAAEIGGADKYLGKLRTAFGSALR